MQRSATDYMLHVQQSRTL